MKPCFFLLCGLLAALFSCKNPDEGSPVIERVWANNVQDDHLHGIAGVTNTLQVKVSDDNELFQLQCALSTPSGLHIHQAEAGEATPPFASPNYGVWDTLNIINISGKEYDHTFSFEAPDTISGGWRLRVSVLDKNGNLSIEDYTVHIQNDSLPAFSISGTDPAAATSGLITATVGSVLSITGNIIDADSLQYVRALLMKGGTEISDQVWDPVNNWTFDLSQVVLPAFPSAGNYILYLYASDVDGWKNNVQASIKVE